MTNIDSMKQYICNKLITLQSLIKNPSYLEKGQILGLGNIAQGGVYEFFDKKNNQIIYAGKMYKFNIEDSYQDAVEEIKVYEMLSKEIPNHQHIIKYNGFIYEIDQALKYIQIILLFEKCQGNLANYLYFLKEKKQRLGFTTLFDFFEQLVLTFYELEGKNFVHRDLKPENILYNKDSSNKITLKITDFSEGQKINFIKYNDQTQLMRGNKYHYSPELWYISNNQQKDFCYFIDLFKNDVYSLGVILVEMASFKKRPEREKEAKINPNQQEIGPYDGEWEKILKETYNFYAGQKYVSDKRQLIGFIEALKSMLAYNPKNRPNFSQLYFKLLDMQDIKLNIVNQYKELKINSENKRDLILFDEYLLTEEQNNDSPQQRININAKQLQIQQSSGFKKESKFDVQLMHEQKDRIKGCLIGPFIGICNRNQMIEFNWDLEFIILLLQSVIEMPINQFTLSIIESKYCQLASEFGSNSDYNTFQNINKKQKCNLKSENCLARSGPLAIFTKQLSEHQKQHLIIEENKLTHTDALVHQSSIVFIYIIQLLVEGFSKQETLRMAAHYSQKHQFIKISNWIEEIKENIIDIDHYSHMQKLDWLKDSFTFCLQIFFLNNIDNLQGYLDLIKDKQPFFIIIVSTLLGSFFGFQQMIQFLAINKQDYQFITANNNTQQLKQSDILKLIDQFIAHIPSKISQF